MYLFPALNYGDCQAYSNRGFTTACGYQQLQSSCEQGAYMIDFI